MSLLEDIFKPIFDVMPRIEIPEFMDSSKGLTLKMKEGGGVQWIQKATKQMKKKGTVGLFTKKAKEHGLSAVAYAKRVIKSPQKHTNKTFKEAMFVKNANPELFAKGGEVSGYTAIINEARYGDTVPDTLVKVKFNTMSELIDWFVSKNLNKKQVTISPKEIRVSIPTNSWGSVYLYNLKEISTDEGIVYRRRTFIRDKNDELVAVPLHISKSVENDILDYVQKFEEEKPLVLRKGGKVKKMASGASVRYSSKRKGPSDSATWYSPGTTQLGNDGNWWMIKENVNGIHRWQKMAKGGKTKEYGDYIDDEGFEISDFGEKYWEEIYSKEDLKKIKNLKVDETVKVTSLMNKNRVSSDAWITRTYAKGGKTQGYDDRLDESLGSRTGRRGTKSQSYKSRRDESKGTEKSMGKRPYSSVGTMDFEL